MATIGLDSLFYAPITEDTSGDETYGTPVKLAKAISAELSIEIAQAILYADDAAAEVSKTFQSGTITLGIDDLGQDSALGLLGITKDSNGVLVSSGEDVIPPVAIGFRARKSNGKYRYFWIYKVTFGTPSINFETKGESINFQTPSIEGTVTLRNKVDTQNKHPWKVEITDGDIDVTESVISAWFDAVYEPSEASNAGGSNA